MELAIEPNVEHNDIIRELLRQMEEHSTGEAGHAERVAVYSVAVGERLGMSQQELVHLRMAAQLHDVGKIQVDRDLLRKIGKLSADEVIELRQHAHRAKKVVESLTWLKPAIPMMVYHHEWWDGTGYPDGLTGEGIPIGARIIAVAEAFDAMIAGVGWREPVSEEDALKEIKRCSGSAYDPKVVTVFFTVQPLIQPVV